MLDALKRAAHAAYHYLVPHFSEDIAVLIRDDSGFYAIVGSIDSVADDLEYDAWIRWDVFTWLGFAYPVTRAEDFEIIEGRFPGFGQSAESAGKSE